MAFFKAFLPGTAFWAVVLCLLFPGCEKTGIKLDNTGQSESSQLQVNFPVYASYKEIPGVTQEEINAIEEFRLSGRSFVYGAYLSSDCFDDNGHMGGFGALFCQWLSNLFDLNFTPVIYEWTNLLNDLETGAIDFTGDLSITSERQKVFLMTSSIAQRPMTFVRLTNSIDPAALAGKQQPRFGFLSNSSTSSKVTSVLPYDFDIVYVDTVKDARRLLMDNQIDAFVKEGHEINGEQDGLIETEIFPPIYNTVSLTASKAELAPIISVVQKYLDYGALYHLVKLYNQGNKEYLIYRFHTSLTEQEKAYVSAHSGNQSIPLVMSHDHYPWAFYNTTEKVWQGIARDVLNEIEQISGLSFKVVNSNDNNWTEQLAMLESGDAAIISELIHSNELQDRFIWSEVPYARDNYALLSKQNTPDVGINEVRYTKVGLLSNVNSTQFFHSLFPDHYNTVKYFTSEKALNGLKNGEVDLYMATGDTLLVLTNYMEEPGYKVNLIFHGSTADSFFGFNRNEKLLCSIIGKAQILVNVEQVKNRWLTRTFDYHAKLIRTRQLYLMGFSALLGVVVFLLIVLLQKYRQSGHLLRVMVKRRTIELEIQKNAAQLAYKVKNRFLANMSHEIRTPLNAIIGLSQTELEKTPTKESKENLSSINRSGSVLLGVVNDLLDISNIESGEMELKTADYSLPAFISSSAASAKLRIGSKKIEFHLEADENLPIKLHGDEKRVRQIIGNLLSNAVKFTNEGDIFFRIGFEAQEDSDTLTLIFEVCDTGIGIKSEHLSNIFSDYNQADTESNRSADGIGMGLLITKKLAKLMGGDVYVVSEYGKGSVFTAWMPQKIADKTVLGSDIAEKLNTLNWKEIQEEKPNLSYARVLVVDDVATNHAVARGMMRPYKLTIDAVLSGQEAIDLISRAETRYDAIFMDHMMPGMDGMEAVKHIRDLKTDYAQNVPIFALTANVLPGNEEYFLANGFNAFIAKPIIANVLNKVLIKWVRDEEKEKLLSMEPQEDEQSQNDNLNAFNIEGVDLIAGVAQFGGAENYLEIVKVFVNDTPKLLGDIQSFIQKFTIMPAAAAAALDALKNYSITVHGIKGSCYGICAAQVGDLAKELEMAAKAQNLSRIMELNNKFIDATKKLVDELKILFPKKEEKPRLEKHAPDPALLEKLLKAAQSYDINKMFAILNELEEYEYKEKEGLVQQLRQAADNYEYREVINLLGPVRNSESNDSEYLSETTG